MNDDIDLLVQTGEVTFVLRDNKIPQQIGKVRIFLIHHYQQIEQCGRFFIRVPAFSHPTKVISEQLRRGSFEDENFARRIQRIIFSFIPFMKTEHANGKNPIIFIKHAKMGPIYFWHLDQNAFFTIWRFMNDDVINSVSWHKRELDLKNKPGRLK
jgi:hypothetical protein